MSSLTDLSLEPLSTLPDRKIDGHKGTYGRLLLVGGSQGMAGAISLAGMAALRSGAGLVTVATPSSVQPTVASFCPAYMTVALPTEQDEAGTLAAAATEQVAALAEQANVIAIGPGLGRSPAVQQFVEPLYTNLPQPMVVDADALNALAHSPHALTSPGGPRILTPHAGELARLQGDELPADTLSKETEARVAAAVELARRDASGQTVVVLKGPGSVIATATSYAINPTGNPGMATAGAGDVLTGMIAAMLGQGLEPWAAARLAVYLHGLAGDLAASDLGQVSLMATDLVDFLPAAFQT